MSGIASCPRAHCHGAPPPCRREGEMQAAMHAAMRPDTATAASRDVAVRAVEAGAVLVACPSGQGDRLADVPVVLQMPRGNIEGVSPRALVLTALVGALRRRDFAEAWRLATLQRVDLNLLVRLYHPIRCLD
jgi:elongator complex protein 1